MYPPTSGRTRHRELVIPLVVLGVGACLAVLLVAVIGLTGGLAEARQDEDEVPQVAPDEKVEGVPWTVTVIDAALFPANALEPATRPYGGDHWLVVLAEVEVTADTTFKVPQALRVSGIDGVLMSEGRDPPEQAAPEVWRTRDSTQANYLEPGLPERLLFLWQRTGDAVPEEIQVEIMQETYRISGISPYEHLWGKRSEWLDREPLARVAIPLKDRRDDPEFQEDA